MGHARKCRCGEACQCPQCPRTRSSPKFKNEVLHGGTSGRLESAVVCRQVDMVCHSSAHAILQPEASRLVARCWDPPQWEVKRPASAARRPRQVVPVRVWCGRCPAVLSQTRLCRSMVVSECWGFARVPVCRLCPVSQVQCRVAQEKAEWAPRYGARAEERRKWSANCPEAGRRARAAAAEQVSAQTSEGRRAKEVLF